MLRASRPMPQALMPAVFVVLWSTGFIGAKLGLPFAEPLTFLALRFAIVVVLLGAVALVLRAPWPRDLRLVGHLLVVGVLVHAIYLGGVFVAIHQGVPAGLSALIVGLQPLLTAAVVGPLLGERVRPRQWLGLALGLVGVLLVVSERIDWSAPGAFSGFGWAALAVNVAALFSITGGTLYQKRYCASMDLRTGTVVQYLGAVAVTGLGAFLLEERTIVWSTDFVIALAWLVLVLSIGAIFLLMVLIRRGAAARTASLFYLVPPCTAVVAWAVFDELLGIAALCGLAVAAIGVALVIRR